jgi:uncharacterized membrane protein YgaE (UPF0421/DUF939 family)
VLVRWFRAAPARRLRAAALTIMQASLAAMLAWSFSRYVLDRPDPIFAPLAAISAIGVSLERRLRPSVEMVLGVAVGILVGDALVFWLGRGTWQLGLVVALAMAAAVLVRGGPVIVLQASSTAVVIATVLPAAGGDQAFAVGRFVDALVGGAVGLAVTVLLPANPLREVVRVAGPLLGGLAEALTRLATALRERDQEMAGTALAEAHGLQVSVEQLAQTVRASHELAVLAPARWSARGTLGLLEDALPYADAAVRDTRVLARQTLAALQRGDAIPPGLDAAIDECAVAVTLLQRAVDSGGDLGSARSAAVRAAQSASEALAHTAGMLAQTVAGQIRAVASDVLYATGLTADDVYDLLPDLPQPISRRSRGRGEQVPPGSDAG